MDRISEEERFGIPPRHMDKGATKSEEARFVSSKQDPANEDYAKKYPVENNNGGNGDEEELEDLQEKLKGTCRGNKDCSMMYDLLEECNDRVNSREMTKETCEQELYDFVGCVDSCVAKDLFKYLK